MNKKMKLNIIDIFSGAGGFSKGFEQAGFNVKYGFDFDQDAINTFNFNHGKTAEGMVADLSSKEELKKILTLLSKTSVDGIIGGPPCQGFSLAGPRRENDPRNKLYFSMIEIAKEASPQFVLIENVPSLATLYGGEALKNIYADLRKIGYYATHTVLKASDFSIPQIRRRLFIVAFKNKQNLEKFKFPEKSNKQVTVRDAISDLPILGEVHTDGIFKYLNEACTTYQKKMRKNSTMIFNHQNSKHTDTTIKMLKLIESGKNAKSLPPKYRAKYTYNDALTRMD